MKVSFDPRADALVITFSDDRIKESDEIRSGVIVDFGYDDSVVRIEILDASKIVQNMKEILFTFSEST